MKNYADGRVFTGAKAVELGFADKVGIFDDAVKLTAEMAGLGDQYELFEIPKKRRSLFDLGEPNEDDPVNALFESKKMGALPLAKELIKDTLKLNLLNQFNILKTNINDALRYLISINQIINNNLIINLNKDDLGYLLNICSDLKMDREHISYHHQYESFWSTKVRMNEDKLKEIKLNIYHHLHLISNLFNKEEWSKKLESYEMLGIPLSLDYIDQNLSMETIDFDLLN
jgi:hypothetical protein